MSTLQAIILAIVEGITEFLPISSTGHMIIASTIMGIQHDSFVKMFEVVIQFGAILSVVVLYWKKFLPVNKSWKEWFDFYLKLLVAFIPAVAFGLLFHDVINKLLGSVTIVAISMLAGGIVLLFIDRIFKESEDSVEKLITFPMALKIGLFQVISMIPGVSRSAATIVGGMSQKLSRKQAAEFSFFLAVPTMFAASALDLFDYLSDSFNQEMGKSILSASHAEIQTYVHSANTGNLISLLLGFAVAFIVAMIAIKGFVNFLTKHGFRIFGWYRIVVGILLLILIAMDVNLRML